MERIDSYGYTYFRSHDNEKQKLRNKKKSQKTVFRSLFSSLETEQQDIEAFAALNVEEQKLIIEEILDEVHETGEKLKKNPTIELIKRYKRAVKAFLRYIIDHSMSVEKTQLSRFKVLRTNGQKELTLITIIDEKLEKLAAGIFQNQKKQFELLSKVDEIYGLLVDFIR